MKKNIYIGIDGGATKTKALAEDSASNFLGKAVSGHSCIRISVEESWHSILDATRKALQESGISLEDQNYNFHLCVGLSGCEIPDAKTRFLNTPHPFKTLLLKSDQYTACMGAHDGQDGAIIIIGTGVVGFQIYQQKISSVGGFGFPHDDIGGGAWLGLQAATLTFQWADGRFKSNSPLVKSVFQKFNNDLTEFTVWANRAKSTQFAELARLVIQHAEQKEKLSLHLFKLAAKMIDKIGATLVRKTGDNTILPCALIGGVASHMVAFLGPKLQARLVNAKYDPAKGAIIALRKTIKN